MALILGFFFWVWQNGNLMRSIRLSRCKYSWVLWSAAAAHHALMLDQHGESKRSFTTTLPSPSLFSPMPPQFQRFRIGPEGSPSPSRRGEVRELVRRKVLARCGRPPCSAPHSIGLRVELNHSPSTFSNELSSLPCVIHFLNHPVQTWGQGLEGDLALLRDLGIYAHSLALYICT